VAQAAPYYSSAAADRSESATRRSESDGRKECGDRAHAMHTAAVSHQRKFADSAETAAAAALLLTSSRSSTSSSLSSQTSLTSVTSLTHIQSVPRQPLNSVYRLSLRTATVAASTHQLTSSAARLASTRHPPSPSLLFPLRLSLLSEHAASICLPWTWGEVMARSHHLPAAYAGHALGPTHALYVVSNAQHARHAHHANRTGGKKYPSSRAKIWSASASASAD
jgi:hypothetical protein